MKEEGVGERTGVEKGGTGREKEKGERGAKGPNVIGTVRETDRREGVKEREGARRDGS